MDPFIQTIETALIDGRENMLFFSVSKASGGNTWMRVAPVHVQNEKNQKQMTDFLLVGKKHKILQTRVLPPPVFFFFVMCDFLISSKAIPASASH